MKVVCTILTLTLIFQGICMAQSISKAQASEDIRFFNQTIQSKYPDPERHFPNYEAYSDSLIGVLEDKVPMNEFAQMMAKYANEFGDGHTFIQNSEIPSDAKVFPYQIKIKESKGFLSKSLLPDTNPNLIGAEIKRLNQVDFSAILTKSLEMAGGETKAHRMERIEGSFADYLYRLEGEISVIEVIDENESRTFSPTSITRAQWLSFDELDAKPKYAFQLIDAEKGLIIFSDMNDINKSQFAKFLKDTFKTLADKKIKTLIIDLRDNGGGNFMFGEMLLDYLTDMPYTIHQKYQYDMLGKKVNPKMVNPIRPKSQKNRFSGDLFFLTSAYTYSSAATIVAAVKYNGLGKIVGQPIGQPYSGFIDMMTFQLPHSKLVCGTSTVYYEYAGINEKNADLGIPPDILTDQDALEFLLGN
ncbi:S41 family peptidase [Pararhodonellum marinum]|uniref:S41 family peptidase n=1 Tax=Pararhodonellum marinum TaxID=2755358 RepID=UPI00188F4A21|nr:S41 family peptidase [Pararhodonellum marinum]